MSAKPTTPCETDKLPGMPCASHAELMDAIVGIQSRVDEVHTALVGNPTLGHRGLVERVDAVEKTAERHDRKLLVWGAILTAAGSVVGVVAQLFIK